MTKVTQTIIHAQIISSLKEKDTFRFKVTGNCMWPLIKKSDWVFIEPIHTDLGIQTGEIVLIDRGVDFVVHRLIKISDSDIISQGDWSRFPDPPLKIEQILGHVITIEKRRCRLRVNHPFVRVINGIIYFISSLYRKIYFIKGVIYETFNHPHSK